ncbi:hypothetical protein NYB23_004583 [Salmonella enterica]|nr:hypothetical protein [Salmonella enterica]
MTRARLLFLTLAVLLASIVWWQLSPSTYLAYGWIVCAAIGGSVAIVLRLWPRLGL